MLEMQEKIELTSVLITLSTRLPVRLAFSEIMFPGNSPLFNIQRGNILPLPHSLSLQVRRACVCVCVCVMESEVERRWSRTLEKECLFRVFVRETVCLYVCVCVCVWLGVQL